MTNNDYQWLPMTTNDYRWLSLYGGMFLLGGTNIVFALIELGQGFIVGWLVIIGGMIITFLGQGFIGGDYQHLGAQSLATWHICHCVCGSCSVSSISIVNSVSSICGGATSCFLMVYLNDTYELISSQVLFRENDSVPMKPFGHTISSQAFPTSYRSSGTSTRTRLARSSVACGRSSRRRRPTPTCSPSCPSRWSATWPSADLSTSSLSPTWEERSSSPPFAGPSPCAPVSPTSSTQSRNTVCTLYVRKVFQDQLHPLPLPRWTARTWVCVLRHAPHTWGFPAPPLITLPQNDKWSCSGTRSTRSPSSASSSFPFSSSPSSMSPWSWWSRQQRKHLSGQLSFAINDKWADVFFDAIKVKFKNFPKTEKTHSP